MYASNSARLIGSLAMGLFLAGGCGEQWDVIPQWGTATYTYLKQIKPVLDKSCVSCHGATAPKGSYDLSSYTGLLGPGKDLKRNAVAGDKTSALLTTLATDATHKDKLTAKELTMLTSWVVDDKLAYFDSSTHNPWWVYPGDRASKAFHGGDLRANKWSMEGCKGCHGEDLKGGTSKKSCYTCHTAGPTSCGSCHGTTASGGAPAPDLAWNLDPSVITVGLHAAHLAGSKLRDKLPCDSCHLVPKKLDDKGHLDTDSPAEVTFSAVASGKKAGVSLKPKWNRAEGTCTNVFCHSLDAGDVTSWTWTKKTAAGLTCSSCHGNPPTKTSSGSKHSSGTDCTGCHSGAYKNGAINPATHINGEVDL